VAILTYERDEGLQINRDLICGSLRTIRCLPDDSEIGGIANRTVLPCAKENGISDGTHEA